MPTTLINARWSATNDYTVTNGALLSKSTIGARNLGEGKFYYEIVNANTSANRWFGVSSQIDPAWVSGGNIPQTHRTIATDLVVNATYGFHLDLTSTTMGRIRYNVNGGAFSEWFDIVDSSGVPLSTIRPIIGSSASANSTTAIYTINGGQSPFSTDIQKLSLTDSQFLGTHYFDGSGTVYLNKYLISSNDETYSFEYTKSFKQQYPPDMTSNTAPSPYVASASSEYNASTSPAWKAFNSNTTGTDNQSWSTASGSNFWLKLDLGAGNEKVIQGFHIHAYRFAGTGNPPNKVTLQGSNDNSNFDDLYSYIPEVATWNNKIVYEFDNDKSYRYYRLLMPTPSSTSLMIRDFRLYEYDEQQKVINLSSSNESNLVKYGLDKGRKIDFTLPMSSKSYILQDSVALGSGKVFSKKITRDIIKAQIK